MWVTRSVGAQPHWSGGFNSSLGQILEDGKSSFCSFSSSIIALYRDPLKEISFSEHV